MTETSTNEELASLDRVMQAELDQTDLEDRDVDLGMVIDLQRCVGCEGCNIACKLENNLQEGVAYSSRITRTEGEFPNVSYEYVPTLCNQCRDAPCAEGCPTTALEKGPGGITVQNPDQCIGCKYCMINCPYDEIFFNKEDPHPRWRDDESAIEGGTASPAELKEELDIDEDAPAYYNPNREVDDTEHPTRYRGIVEKCNFCIHRLRENELPACVEECPTDARIFGDLNDPESKVSDILGKYGGGEVLKPEKGTEPKVKYVREYNGGSYEPGKGDAGLGD
ncbi:4Fe-4S ferredoxin iron-sulfur binding domain protein [Halalkaliarchaeum desulfuricum]|uniref:4Fe-4S ferredoxin iron-sulfur binding domain protein n=1 Tax=Halalkaliarchaeum desulfuricum TaxID=2055893 RepID=A0A343TMH8_9EURY|nr:4Fe-4S dicluster domain-containing protein [Halalkaliarchaeum desulfuricum]AUX10300.1 4Fe-4S ferredoxin iron-sulfur binding domain protein [Halalkaliarchaeum desulfuricum]